MKAKFLFILSALLCACTASNNAIELIDSKLESESNIKVRRTCSEPRGTKIQTVLVEVVCLGSKPCYPDPDDMPLWDVEKNKSTNWAVSDIVLIDENDQIINNFKKGEQRITVWDISLSSAEAPRVGDLSYDNMPYGFNFSLDQNCSIFPEHILLKLGVRDSS